MSEKLGIQPLTQEDYHYVKDVYFNLGGSGMGMRMVPPADAGRFLQLLTEYGLRVPATEGSNLDPGYGYEVRLLGMVMPLEISPKAISRAKKLASKLPEQEIAGIHDYELLRKIVYHEIRMRANPYQLNSIVRKVYEARWGLSINPRSRQLLTILREEKDDYREEESARQSK